jgi:acetyl-CoA acetyltransferase
VCHAPYADYGTTSEQLAWIKVAASHHAQYNPHAMLKDVVTVEDVLNSPMISDPLHRMDCCVVSDGGGALIVTTPEIAKSTRARPFSVFILIAMLRLLRGWRSETRCRAQARERAAIRVFRRPALLLQT